MTEDQVRKRSFAFLTVSTRPVGTALLLVLTDLLALTSAAALGLWARGFFEGRIRFELYWKLFPILLVFVVIYAAMELYPGVVLYPGVALGPAEELRRATEATTLVYLALAASSFMMQGGMVYSRAVFLIGWALSLFFVPVARAFVRHFFARKKWWGHPAVVLGGGETGLRVIQALQRNPGLGLKAIAVLDDNPTRPDAVAGVPVAGGVELAPDLAELGVPYAIVAVADIPRERIPQLLEQYGQIFPHLLIIPDLFHISSLWVVAKDLGGVLGLEVREQLLLPGPRRLKRVLDVFLTVVSGIMAMPLMIFIAILIKLDSRGPVFFAQERLGWSGRRFKALKFRSMYRDAEDVLQKLLAEDPEMREEYATYHKLRHDPRVTRVGRLIRKWSLDEVPQLWNVLKGEMSLVGPRAYMPKELPKMQEREPIILRARPGITGLWQVNGRNDVSFSERLAMDVYYVRNWSLWFDLYIMARTVLVVFGGKGAY